MLGTDYIKGLETGLTWLKSMQDYDIDTDVPGAREIIAGILEMIVADYTDKLEAEKAELIRSGTLWSR